MSETETQQSAVAVVTPAEVAVAQPSPGIGHNQSPMERLVTLGNQAIANWGRADVSRSKARQTMAYVAMCMHQEFLSEGRKDKDGKLLASWNEVLTVSAAARPIATLICAKLGMVVPQKVKKSLPTQGYLDAMTAFRSRVAYVSSSVQFASELDAWGVKPEHFDEKASRFRVPMALLLGNDHCPAQQEEKKTTLLPSDNAWHWLDGTNFCYTTKNGTGGLLTVPVTEELVKKLALKDPRAKDEAKSKAGKASSGRAGSSKSEKQSTAPTPNLPNKVRADFDGYVQQAYKIVLSWKKLEASKQAAPLAWSAFDDATKTALSGLAAYRDECVARQNALDEADKKATSSSPTKNGKKAAA